MCIPLCHHLGMRQTYSPPSCPTIPKMKPGSPGGVVLFGRRSQFLNIGIGHNRMAIWTWDPGLLVAVPFTERRQGANPILREVPEPTLGEASPPRGQDRRTCFEAPGGPQEKDRKRVVPKIRNSQKLLGFHLVSPSNHQKKVGGVHCSRSPF